MIIANNILVNELGNYLATIGVYLQKYLSVFSQHADAINKYCVVTYAFFVERVATEAPFSNDFALLCLKVGFTCLIQNRTNKNEPKVNVNEPVCA